MILLREFMSRQIIPLAMGCSRRMGVGCEVVQGVRLTRHWTENGGALFGRKQGYLFFC
jgi:hypothetical protein